MSESNSEIGKLHINSRVSTNYAERAMDLRKYSMDLEKWLLTILVIAGGSAFSFATLQIINISGSTPYYFLFIICDWFFAISIFFSFYGIAYYSSGLALRSEELISRGNKQDGENDLSSILQIIVEALGSSEKFKKLPDEEQLNMIFDKNFLINQLSGASKKSYFSKQKHIKKLEVNIEKLGKKFHKQYKIFRIYISISFVLLLIGMAIPLIFFSYKVVNYGW